MVLGFTGTRKYTPRRICEEGRVIFRLIGAFLLLLFTLIIPPTREPT